MKCTIKSVTNFVKENKILVEACALSLCISSGLIITALDAQNKKHKLITSPQFHRMDIPEIDVGEIVDLWGDECGADVMFRNITVDQLGAFSKELKKNRRCNWRNNG